MGRLDFPFSAIAGGQFGHAVVPIMPHLMSLLCPFPEAKLDEMKVAGMTVGGG